MSDSPRLYHDLAGWFHLLTAPEDYAEEAEVYRRVLIESSEIQVGRVLELGSGGGNNASHLKAGFELTLVDLAPAMLEVSGALNPECRHVVGDMRTVRLGERFDAVFAHDAVSYMTTESDLAAVAATARAHCRPGGVALFVPDFVSETFRPGTGHGGHDQSERGLRYLEWRWDPDPADTTYLVDMAYLLRAGRDVSVVHDRHTLGLFPTDIWLGVLDDAGFSAHVATAELSDGDVLHMFVATAAHLDGA
jgi:SAM-dependent methyltransferase